jgi:ACS family tartrate transporter-like MFS transporter
MLVLEGIPAVVGGILCFLFLTDRPQQAKWLTQAEKDWLLGEQEKDRKDRPAAVHLDFSKTITNPRVLYLSFIYFVYQCGSLGTGYWMPQIIKSFSASLSHTQVGLIAVIPYLIATIVMIVWSKSSDRRNERRLHSAIPLGVAALAMLGTGLVADPVVAITMISLSLAGLYAFKSPFWALPTLFLSRESASVSIAIINSIGNLGGFVGPFFIGYVKGSTQSATTGLMLLAGLVFVAFLMTVFIRINEHRAAAAAGGAPVRKAH